MILRIQWGQNWLNTVLCNNRYMYFFTERYDRALVFARRRHQKQLRKGTGIPYFAHLMATSSLVLEAGGNEDQAIAGLLHDALEDSDVTAVTYDELVTEFGPTVANIVRDCSDSEEADKPPWRERKEAYLAALAHHSPDSVLVSNADKLHNARSILSDYYRHGEELWSRFNQDGDPLWYYRSLADKYSELGSPLADELGRVVAELEELVQANTPTD